jgi:hypothetical protein
MNVEILTDSRLQPAKEPKPEPTDAIVESLRRIERMLESIFWACGGPMAAQGNQQLFMAYHPEARPEQPKIVVPK